MIRIITHIILYITFINISNTQMSSKNSNIKNVDIELPKNLAFTSKKIDLQVKAKENKTTNHILKVIEKNPSYFSPQFKVSPKRIKTISEFVKK